jgi:predicted DsbA family dithiol-disulfide isomerase
MKKVSEVLKERGRRVGIDFNLAGKTRQTTNAHRLSLKAWLCGGEAAQTKMVSALFAAYFEKETDIGCYDFLSKAAESTGLMTAEHARAFLMSDKLLDEVKCLIRHSVLREIKGVPFTIVANQWAIQGAETAESFYRVSSSRQVIINHFYLSRLWPSGSQCFTDVVFFVGFTYRLCDVDVRSLSLFLSSYRRPFFVT